MDDPSQPSFWVDLEHSDFMKRIYQVTGVEITRSDSSDHDVVTIRKELFGGSTKTKPPKNESYVGYVHHLNATYNPSLHGSIISHHNFKCPTLIALLQFLNSQKNIF